MNKTVPSPTNWPEGKAAQKLKAKRSRLIPIACGNELDPEGQLLRITRTFQKDDPGRLEGFVAGFLYRDKNGNRRIQYSAHGRIGRENQIMIVRKLSHWVENDESD